MRQRPTSQRSPSRAVVFVDSSAWIALFSARDRRHDEAIALFRAAVARRARLITTTLVVAEVHRFVLFRVGIHAARLTIARIEATPGIVIVSPGQLHHDGAKAWLDRLNDVVLSYTDAVSFAAMVDCGAAAVLTFDSDFMVAGFVPWQG